MGTWEQGPQRRHLVSRKLQDDSDPPKTGRSAGGRTRPPSATSERGQRLGAIAAGSGGTPSPPLWGFRLCSHLAPAFLPKDSRRPTRDIHRYWVGRGSCPARAQSLRTPSGQFLGPRCVNTAVPRRIPVLGAGERDWRLSRPVSPSHALMCTENPQGS